MNETRVTKPTEEEIQAARGDGDAMAMIAERFYDHEQQDFADMDAEMVAQHNKEQAKLKRRSERELRSEGLTYCHYCDEVHEYDSFASYNPGTRQMGRGKYCREVR